MIFLASDDIIMWLFFFQFVYMMNECDSILCVEISIYLWDVVYFVTVDDRSLLNLFNVYCYLGPVCL